MERLLSKLPYVALVAAVAVALQLSAQDQADDTAAKAAAALKIVEKESRRIQVEACNRGNVLRADRKIDSLDPDDTPAERARVKVLFPIIDCEKTIETGSRTVLEDAEATKYIDLVTDSIVPDIRDGRVQGKINRVAPAGKPIPAP